jgi:hypothetical protein
MKQRLHQNFGHLLIRRYGNLDLMRGTLGNSLAKKNFFLRFLITILGALPRWA